MASLTQSQQDALAQLRDLSGGGDDDVNTAILESVDWDLQRAVEVMFDGSSAAPAPAARPPAPEPTPRRIEQFEVDDSEQGGADDFDQRRGNEFPMNPRPSTFLQVLSFPIQLVANIFRFIFTVLRIPLPHIPFLSLNFYRPVRPTRARSRGVDSWIRELEEETGAFCIGQNTSTATGVAGPSSDTLSHRGPVQKQLPKFVVGNYEEILRRCQRENRVGCIVLVSEEHDDDVEFKRTTLTDPTFVNVLTDSNFIVWGGDVRDLEPYSASEKLQATSYPFVAFVANQPSRSSTSGAPTLTVLSRHQGLSNTTPTKLVEHLTGNLLPRVQPYIQRLLNSQQELEHNRMLRQQQDQAFADAANRDADRIRAKIAAEEAASKRAAEEEAQRKHEAEERARIAKERMSWRRYARKALIPPEQPTDRLRIALRLPNGSRLMRKFNPDTTLTGLYAYVDQEFIPKDAVEAMDPQTPPRAGDVDANIDGMGGSREWWGFKLASTYPRADVLWSPNMRLGDVACLKDGGGQLVVEMVGESSRRSSTDRVNSLDDDGYETESDEE